MWKSIDRELQILSIEQYSNRSLQKDVFKIQIETRDRKNIPFISAGDEEDRGNGIDDIHDIDEYSGRQKNKVFLA